MAKMTLLFYILGRRRGFRFLTHRHATRGVGMLIRPAAGTRKPPRWSRTSFVDKKLSLADPIRCHPPTARRSSSTGSTLCPAAQNLSCVGRPLAILSASNVSHASPEACGCLQTPLAFSRCLAAPTAFPFFSPLIDRSNAEFCRPPHDFVRR